jgi:hypothetical protein
MAHHSSTKSHGYEEFCMIQGGLPLFLLPTAVAMTVMCCRDLQLQLCCLS